MTGGGRRDLKQKEEKGGVHWDNTALYLRIFVEGWQGIPSPSFSLNLKKLTSAPMNSQYYADFSLPQDSEYCYINYCEGKWIESILYLVPLNPD